MLSWLWNSLLPSFVFYMLAKWYVELLKLPSCVQVVENVLLALVSVGDWHVRARRCQALGLCNLQM